MPVHPERRQGVASKHFGKGGEQLGPAAPLPCCGRRRQKVCMLAGAALLVLSHDSASGTLSWRHRMSPPFELSLHAWPIVSPSQILLGIQELLDTPNNNDAVRSGGPGAHFSRCHSAQLWWPFAGFPRSPAARFWPNTADQAPQRQRACTAFFSRHLPLFTQHAFALATFHRTIVRASSLPFPPCAPPACLLPQAQQAAYDVFRKNQTEYKRRVARPPAPFSASHSSLPSRDACGWLTHAHPAPTHPPYPTQPQALEVKKYPDPVGMSGGGGGGAGGSDEVIVL